MPSTFLCLVWDRGVGIGSDWKAWTLSATLAVGDDRHISQWILMEPKCSTNIIMRTF